MQKTFLDTWIPLGLHRDQSKYMGWVLKPSTHNSINVLSSNFTRNSISIASSYVRADQLIMDSFQLQCTQHGLVTITLHITRLINNWVMWKTNHHSGHSILVLRPMASTVTIAQQKTVWRTRSMSSYQQRDNGDGPADLTTKAMHFFKIIMPGTLQEGKLVSILYFLIFFLSLKIIC